MYPISSSWCFLWWSTFIIVIFLVMIYFHQTQFLASSLLFWHNIKQSWPFCDGVYFDLTFSFLMNQFFIWFKSSQDKSCVLDHIYMLIIRVASCTDLCPSSSLRSTTRLWSVTYRFDIVLPLAPIVHCVKSTLMIHQQSWFFFTSVLLVLEITVTSHYPSIFIIFWFNSSQVKCVGSSDFDSVPTTSCIGRPSDTGVIEYWLSWLLRQSIFTKFISLSQV